MMQQKDLQILYEDKDIIVCVKPAGVPTQSDRTGAYDLTSQLMNHLAQKQRSGESGAKARAAMEPPYLAVIHRLDRPVGGVMVFAKTRKAAAELSRQVQEHRMTKRYYCVLTSSTKVLSEDSADRWQSRIDYLVTDKRTNRSRITTKKDKDAKKAELRWRGIEAAEKSVATEGCDQPVPELLLTEVELLTGRHHQIRVQMTQVAEGLWGDTKYNPAFTEKKGWYDLALFSHELMFTHPVTGKVMHFTAVPEGEVFQKFSYIQRLRER